MRRWHRAGSVCERWHHSLQRDLASMQPGRRWDRGRQRVAPDCFAQWKLGLGLRWICCQAICGCEYKSNLYWSGSCRLHFRAQCQLFFERSHGVRASGRRWHYLVRQCWRWRVMCDPKRSIFWAATRLPLEHQGGREWCQCLPAAGVVPGSGASVFLRGWCQCLPGSSMITSKAATNDHLKTGHHEVTETGFV